MIFTEFRFVLFFLFVFALAWAVRGHRTHKLVLLAASYSFYAAWDWRFLSLILFSTLLDYWVGARLERTQALRPRRLLLATSLGANLGLLGVFKYLGFFVDSAVEFTAWIGLPLSQPSLQIILPVGISFYTFQTLSYTIDVYRREIPATHSVLDFAVFVAFFPQLVAGPIVRARTFLPQLADRPRFENVAVRSNLLLFGGGFIKKAVIADQLALVVDRVFAEPLAFSTASAWLASILYTIQIYCDFSGYTDMALACAGFLGYRLTANFDAPFTSRSIREFWRRWHISLSTWFRDYLYIGLGGNRRGPSRTAFNLLMVFLLCGLWHGAAWNFVVWGLVHGAAIAAERLALPTTRGLIPGAIGWLYTTLIVVLAFVVFRSPDLLTARDMFQVLFGMAGEWSRISLGWLALAGALMVGHATLARWPQRERLARLPVPVFAVAYCATIALVLPWVQAGYKPFIYFQF